MKSFLHQQCLKLIPRRRRPPQQHLILTMISTTIHLFNRHLSLIRIFLSIHPPRIIPLRPIWRAIPMWMMNRNPIQRSPCTMPSTTINNRRQIIPCSLRLPHQRWFPWNPRTQWCWQRGNPTQKNQSKHYQRPINISKRGLSCETSSLPDVNNKRPRLEHDHHHHHHHLAPIDYESNPLADKIELYATNNNNNNNGYVTNNYPTEPAYHHASVIVDSQQYFLNGWNGATAF